MDKIFKHSKLKESMDYIFDYDDFSTVEFNEEDEILDLFYILRKERLKENYEV